MLYRGLRLAARAAPKLSLYNTSSALRQLPVQFQHVRTYADKIIKVPTMAESISEGTLKQWNKAIGDFVEQDEEIATIETDKVGYSSTMVRRLTWTYTSFRTPDRCGRERPGIRHHQGVLGQ
jgi:hypothetical protein